ncbi:hypothetical protein BpHYR1_005878 [Brachionus plicatilis]|uniref:G-protein coupled receptors family 1 profile domain-containing protein n=1 Tax=Brachionus plicatilis TaxID=10195 RepID=A0A3M7R593_BRAPC|nr:hypothetical protein BpHYR1_005878 [Brachionus plicatilis]
MDYRINQSDYYYDETREPEVTVIESSADIITNQGLPVICCLSLCLTILCAGILSKPVFKGTFYRYLLYSSIFDSITLTSVMIRPLLRRNLTEDIHELYFYCFITSFSETTANLIKIVISLDRYSRMTSTFRHISRRSPCVLLWSCVIISFLITSPLLFYHDYLEFEWYKLTFFELSLTKSGNSNSMGSLILINSIAVCLGIYSLLLFFNTLLKKAINENSKKLFQALEIEKKKIKDIVINMSDENQDLHENDQSTEINFGKKIVNDSKKDISLIESNSLAKSPMEIEKSRQKLTDMIIFLNCIYVIGHSLNMLMCISEQLKNLFGFKNFNVKSGSITDESDMTAWILAISNLILYCSMGVQFFVYFYFSLNFRYFVEKSFKRTFRCLFCLSCSIDQHVPDKTDIFKQI